MTRLKRYGQFWVRYAFLAALVAGLSATSSAATIIDFESFVDGDILTNQIPGLIFANGVVLTSLLSLNELDFPPHSGTNVVSDLGGPIAITFKNPVTGIGGYFTYILPLTIQVFDTNNNLVATTQSNFADNTVTGGASGSSANEFIQITVNSGIGRVVITGSVLGGSYVLDDLTLVTRAGNDVP